MARKLIIAMVLFVIMFGLSVITIYAKDTCWIENYLDTDFTVCRVEGGIYILTPTPTPTDRPKVKHNMGYPVPDSTPECYDPNEPWQCQVLTVVPTWTPRPTPTFAPTQDPYDDFCDLFPDTNWCVDPGTRPR